MDEFPSGQRGQTVNLLLFSFGGPNPPSSTKTGKFRMKLAGFLISAAVTGRSLQGSCRLSLCYWNLVIYINLLTTFMRHDILKSRNKGKGVNPMAYKTAEDS